MSYGCRSGNIDIVVDGDRGDEGSVRANLDAVTNLSAVLVETVIVARDCPCSNVRIATNLCIANVGKMFSFAMLTNVRFFDFDKITNLGLWGKHCSATEVSKWTDL